MQADHTAPAVLSRRRDLGARPVADYAFSDSSNPEWTYARVDQSTKAEEHLISIPARINHDTGRDLAVIAVRVLDDAHMTWVAAEVESEYALRAWFDAGARHGAGAYLAYGAAVEREEAAARDLQRLSDLTQACQERLARSE